MNFAVRVDADEHLGTGHLVRMLTLADELKHRGHNVHFLSQRLPEHLCAMVSASSHAITMLDEDDDWHVPKVAEWPNSMQVRDAQLCNKFLDKSTIVICDHYGLGSAWEVTIRPFVSSLVAVDDLGRHHDCDILLDQNFYSDPDVLYPTNHYTPHRLVGPAYALLRPEFAEARQYVAVRDGAVGRLLVFMGGMDVDNWTGRVIDALDAIGLEEIAVDIVIGSTHPARDSLKDRVANHANWTLHIQTTNMAKLMALADLAIGAGGSATWERCALGLPTIALKLAENQSTVLQQGGRAGFLYALDDVSSEMLVHHIKALIANSGLRSHISANALSLADGRGSERVANLLCARGLSVRPALQIDRDLIYNWRNGLSVRRFSRDTSEIAYDQHCIWFAEVVANPNRWLLIVEQDKYAVGVVRFDRMADPAAAEVSIFLAPECHGRGIGPSALLCAEAWLMDQATGVVRIHATVLEGNAASERLFTNCRYKKTESHFEKRIEA
jgi:UDP-2,4-diacetamido-2,4,6-trideoxy-beta-L-altropyranose hydrolase